MINAGVVARSAQPDVATVQLDGAGFGDVQNSVNLYRGSVNLSFTFLKLDGRNGLDVAVTAQYDSSVREQMRWGNRYAPTGVLGVGWAMPVDAIVADRQQSGNLLAATFFLVSQGQSTPLYRIGSVGNTIAYQLRTSPFWRIEHVPAGAGSPHSHWLIVKEDGSRWWYGAPPGGDPQANGLQYGVKWGNWIGPTTLPGGAATPFAWNLVRIESHRHDEMAFAYEATEVTIGAVGAAYTQSSRLKSVRDSFGRTVTFRYKDKHPSEIELPHVPPHASDPAAFQFVYETKYLDGMVVRAEDGAELFHVDLAFRLEQRPDGIAKRFLERVSQAAPDGTALPDVAFGYRRGDAVTAAGGALERITYPAGGTVTYDYAELSIDQTDRHLRVEAPDTGYRPSVWHGPGYVVVAWFSQARRDARVDVYRWTGTWSSWSSPVLDDVVVDEVRVEVANEFFALAIKNAQTGTWLLHLYHESPYRYGEWLDESVDLGTGAVEIDVVAGGAFVAAATNTSGNVIVRSWNDFAKRWEPAVIETPHGARLLLAAQSNVLLAASVTSAQIRFMLHYADANGVWRDGAVQDYATTVDWELTDARRFWATGPSFAAAGFVRSASPAIQSTVVTLWWNADYGLQGFEARTFEQKPALTNPAGGVAIAGDVVASSQHLLRYGGREWLPFEATDPQPGVRYGYAYGNDVAIAVEVAGEQVRYRPSTFDPYQLEWRRGEAVEAQLEPSEVRLPQIVGDYYALDRRVFYREPDDTWSFAFAVRPEADPATVTNRGSYVAYEIPGSATEVQLVREGNRIGEPIVLPQQHIVDPAGGAGSDLAAPSSFVTYEGSDLANARTLHLYAVVDDAVTGIATACVVSALAVDSGFGTYASAYGYDQSTAAFDPTGTIVQFAVATRAAVAPSAPEGKTKYTYFNGLNPNVPGIVYPPDDAFTNARSFFSYFNGQLFRREEFDDLGRPAGSETNYLYAFDTAAEQPTGGAFVRLRKQVTTEVLPVVAIPAFDMAALEQPDALRALLASEGVRISNRTAAERVGAHLYRLRDAASGESVWIDVRGERAQVLGEFSQTAVMEYNAVGQIARTTTLNVDAAGRPQRITQDAVYAWERYPGVLAAHVYTGVALATTTNASAAKIVAREVTTYANVWPGLADETMWLAHKTYSWLGTGSDLFDFGAWSGSGEPPPAQWLRTSVVDAVDRFGQTLQVRGADGVPSGVVYDRGARVVVASFENAPVLGGVATYYGFAAYEDPGPWTVVPAASGPSAGIVGAPVLSGERALRLPGNAEHRTGLRAGVNVGSDRRLLLGAWVLSEGAGTGRAGWSVEADGAEIAFFPFPDTAGAWRYAHAVFDVPPEADEIVLFAWCGQAGRSVYLDAVGVVPFGAGYDASVYQSTTLLPAASLTHTGLCSKTWYNRFRQPVLVSAVGSVPQSLDSNHLWRQTPDAAFTPASPNTECSIAARTGGSVADFRAGDAWRRTWSATDGWSVAGGALVGHGTIALERGDTSSGVAFAVSLKPLAPIVAPVRLSYGTAVVEWSPGAWRLTTPGGTTTVADAPVLSARELTLLIQPHSAHFFADGRLVFGRVVTEALSGSATFFTAQALAVEYLAALLGPVASVSFNDNAGTARQTQDVNDASVVVAASVYDHAGRAAIATKSLELPGPLGYRADFVRGVDWQTGVMTGVLADALPADEGYPYQRVRFERSPLGRAVERGAPGKPFAITDATAFSPHTTRYEYATNAAATRPLPDLPQSQYRVARVIDPDGNTATIVSDKLGSPVCAAATAPGAPDRALTLVEYVYDVSGNLVEARAPNYFADGERGSKRFAVTMAYDFLGRITARGSANTASPARYVYDRAGRVRFTLSADGAAAGWLIYNRYDRTGRLVETGSCDAAWDEPLLQARADDPAWLPAPPRWQKRVQYDGDGSDLNAIGQLVAAQVAGENGDSVAVAETFAYSRMGAPLARTLAAAGFHDGAVVRSAFDYDALGNVVRLRPGAASGAAAGELRYARDALGRIADVRWTPAGGAETRLLAYRYDAQGALARETFEPDAPDGGLACTWEHNPPGWPVSIVSPPFTERLEYTHGGYGGDGYYGGRVARATSTFAQQPNDPDFVTESSYAMRYDAVGRLAVAQNGDPRWSIGVPSPLAYDPNGNIISYSSGPSLVKYAYEPETDELRSAGAAVAEPAQFAYDPDGFVTAATRRSIVAIAYDRCSKAPLRIVQPGTERRFAYNGNDQLALDAAPGAPRLITFGPSGEVLAELDADGAQRILLPGAAGLAGMIDSAGAAYRVRDHLGSTRALVRGRSLEGAYNYLPFGDFLGPAVSPAWRFDYLFTGQPLARGLGLYDYGARLYDPRLGRFYAPDPAWQFPSPFLYAANDPVNAVDPGGEAAALLVILAAAIIGGTLGGTINMFSNDFENSSPSQRTAYFFTGFGIGAVTGALSAGVGVAVGAAGLGIGAGIVIGALTEGALGALDGYLVNGINNAISGKRGFNENGAMAAGIGFGVGMLLGGVGGALGARAARARGGYQQIGAQPPRAPLTETQAATRIQAAARGFLSRRLLRIAKDLRNPANRLTKNHPLADVGGKRAVKFMMDLGGNGPFPRALYKMNPQTNRISGYAIYNTRGQIMSRVDFDHLHGGMQPHTHVFSVNRNPNNNTIYIQEGGARAPAWFELA